MNNDIEKYVYSIKNRGLGFTSTFIGAPLNERSRTNVICACAKACISAWDDAYLFVGPTTAMNNKGGENAIEAALKFIPDQTKQVFILALSELLKELVTSTLPDVLWDSFVGHFICL